MKTMKKKKAMKWQYVWGSIVLGILVWIGTQQGFLVRKQFEVPSGQVGIVRTVWDGDTIDVDIGGQIKRVRLIGIDAPEFAKEGKEEECFASESTAYMKNLTEGKSVRLEADPTQEDQDIYGRLLRYVFLQDGTNVNTAMVEYGYAKEYTYKGNAYTLQQQFRSSEKSAAYYGRGMWADGACK